MTLARVDTSHDTSCPVPRGTVLLVTCMDLRFIDEIADFMDHDNLTNRYDHVVFAGASLGALGAPGARNEHGEPLDFSHWQKTFWDHLAAAVELHQISDVYLLEHRHCAAYHRVFRVCREFRETPEDQAEEETCHARYAQELARQIETWGETQGRPLQIHSFLMDLRGHVRRLAVPSPISSPHSPSAPSAPLVPESPTGAPNGSPAKGSTRRQSPRRSS